MSDLSKEAREHFEELSGDLPEGDLPTLRAQVRAHLETIEEAARAKELLPIDVAQQLAARLLELLDDYPSLDPAHRAVVVGAARYFCSADDAAPDLEGVLGLDDDVAVFNHAVRTIGRPELVIDL